MPLTPDQLEAFPHTRALFEHEKIQNVVQAHKDYNGEDQWTLAEAIKSDVDGIIPVYTTGKDLHSPVDCLEAGSAKCKNRALILYAVTAQLPVLTTCLLVTSGHAWLASYNAPTQQGIITENDRISIGGVPHGIIYNYPIDPNDRLHDRLRNYEIMRYLRDLPADHTDAQTRMQYWTGTMNTAYASREHLPHRSTHDMSIRVGFAAVRFIERSFIAREAAKNSVPTP